MAGTLTVVHEDSPDKRHEMWRLKAPTMVGYEDAPGVPGDCRVWPGTAATAQQLGRVHRWCRGRLRYWCSVVELVIKQLIEKSGVNHDEADMGNRSNRCNHDLFVAGLRSAQERKNHRERVPAVIMYLDLYPTATIKGFAREKENGKTFCRIESRWRDRPRRALQPRWQRGDRGDHRGKSRCSSSNNWPKYLVQEAEQSIQGGKIGYEVIVKQGKRRISLEFDADGALQNKSH
jgi:hypothetical protein